MQIYLFESLLIRAIISKLSKIFSVLFRPPFFIGSANVRAFILSPKFSFNYFKNILEKHFKNY
jgi:hypothetical protein